MLAQTGLCVRNYAAHFSMAPHEHNEDSISIVMQGEFLERIGTRERRYARGHAVLFPAGVTHSQIFGAAGARQIIFTPRASWLQYLADCKPWPDESPHVIDATTFRHLGDRLVEEIDNDDGFSAIACEGILLEVIAAFGRRGNAATTQATPPAWLCVARDFIHENAVTPVSLAQIAGAAGRHEIHLAREFRRFFGASVGTYSRRLRIEHAARLLLKPTEEGAEFGKRYWTAMQRDPDVVLAHAEAKRLVQKSVFPLN